MNTYYEACGESVPSEWLDEMLGVWVNEDIEEDVR